MYIKNLKITVAIILGLVIASSCTKVNRDDDFKAGDPPPVAGGYVNSDEVAAANLVAHFTFNNTIDDAKGNVTGGALNNGGGYSPGIKGDAYTPTITDVALNRSNTFISYSNPGSIADLTSFTVSLWINTAKHDGGAQGVFTLSKEDGSFWGNFFMLIEGTGAPENNMLVKLHMEKNNATFIEHWLEATGNYRPADMYNGWRHVAWTYDENTSKAMLYINGSKSELPPGQEDRKADGGGTPLGPLDFKDPTKFVIGGFQNNLGTPYNNPEPWMLNYSGKLDEFRIYNKALSAQEINAIRTLERQGR